MQNARSPVRGYDTLDAGLTLGRTDARWLPQIGFNLNNLTDTRGVAIGSADTANAKTFIFVQPRTALLTFKLELLKSTAPLQVRRLTRGSATWCLDQQQEEL